MHTAFSQHRDAPCSVPDCQAVASRFFAYEGQPDDTFYLCEDHAEVLAPDDEVVRLLTPDLKPVERELAVYACHADCPVCGD
jgi:hypothetical protein